LARPQAEDGHIDIANEIVEALCRINLSAYESRVLWALWRKTYGWHKKSDRISYTQREELTHLNRWHIARTLKKLIERNIITCRGNKYNLEYSFQKDYEQWKDLTDRHDLLPKEVTALPIGVTKKSLPRLEKSLPVGVTKSLPNGVNTKENKETIQKKREGPLSLRRQELEFNEFIEELRPQYPDLNFDNELQKFRLYWSEGRRKLERPKLALKNWMDKAREFKQEKKEGKSGAHRQGSRGLKPRQAYKSPEEHRIAGRS